MMEKWRKYKKQKNMIDIMKQENKQNMDRGLISTVTNVRQYRSSPPKSAVSRTMVLLLLLKYISPVFTAGLLETFWSINVLCIP
jgi:hypothetical protein